jgi:hypothetical protein
MNQAAQGVRILFFPLSEETTLLKDSTPNLSNRSWAVSSCSHTAPSDLNLYQSSLFSPFPPTQSPKITACPRLAFTWPPSATSALFN